MIFLNDLKPFGIYTHDFRKKTQCAFMNFDSMCCRAECRILRADARARSWVRPPVPFFLLNVFASRAGARTARCRGAARS